MKQFKFKQKDPIDHYTYLTAFFLPILIMICVFVGNEIYPFGDNSFLRTDMYHQYAPFFAEFRRKLVTGGSLSYTWDIGMGTNFTSLFGYYLSSPFNWLIFLCPKGLVIDFMTYLIVFKIGLCGLSFAIFLRHKTNKPDIGISFFAIFYALSAYLAAYNWNIMWLDCVWLAPLILLGIERLVRDGKCFLYCICLGLAILSNYYIAIMLCIFCVLYFIVTIICTPNNKSGYLRACFQFALYSLLAGALAAILLIPEYYALKYTASSDISFPDTIQTYFSIFAMLARHLMNVETEIGLDHWPNIYSGIAVLLCLPMYFINRKIPAKEKICKGTLMVFLLISFATNVLNFIWHGFHYPNSLPCRQSFLYTALILSMCYEGYKDLLDYKKETLVKVFFGGLAFIILCEQLITEEEFSYITFYCSLIFLALYGLIAYLYNTHKFSSYPLIAMVLVVITVEMTINTAYTSVTTVTRSTYLSFTEDYQTLIKEVKNDDPGFYRFEKYSRKTKNDGAFVGYPSISTFSSTSYGAISDFYRDLGMESSMNAYSNNGITPLINTLFDVKYMLSTVTQEESDLTSYYREYGDGYVYKNNYTLNVGYMLDSNLEKQWNTDNSSPISVQNQFAKLVANTHVFDKIEDTENFDDTFTITVDKPTHIFVEVTNSDITEVSATIGDDTKSFSNVDRGFLLDLGVCYPEDDISLSTSDDAVFTADAYGVNQDGVIAVYNKLSKQQLEVTNYTDTTIDGTITCTNDGRMLLSIPYDPGWTLTVDGKETDLLTFKDSLLSANLTKGTHSIHLEYHTQGLQIGTYITAVAIILLILLFFLKKFRKPNPTKPIEIEMNDEEDEEEEIA